MNIKVEISKSEVVKAGDVYLKVKSSGSDKVLGQMIHIFKDTDGTNYSFVVIGDGSIHKVKSEFLTVVDQDYLGSVEVTEPVPEADESQEEGNWWEKSRGDLWDKFRRR